MTLFNSCIEAIGKTPLIRLSRSTGTSAGILAKAEYFNPLGSVKDRPGAAMIAAAEKDGRLFPGCRLVEPTSGNTGIALAFVAAVKGYAITLVIPETMSDERKKLLVHLGADLVLTPGRLGMAGAIEAAREMAEKGPDVFMPDQFSNPANAEAHERTTAEEIWADTGGNVDILVAGVGTGGTLTGISRNLKARKPGFRTIAVEPEASPVLSGGKPGPHPIQGIGAGFIPDILDVSLIDDVVRVSGDAAMETAREIAKTHGLLCGISSGAAVFAARQVAMWPDSAGKEIVVVLPSTGERYISTALFV